MWLFVLFLAIPLIEIALFVNVGGAIGIWWTLAIVIATAVLGTQMIRAQGALAMNDVRKSLDELRDPTEPLAHGAMILLAGVLLLTPGFFTDSVGLALLFPPIRHAVYTFVRSRVKVQNFTVGGSAGASRPVNDPGGTVIDGEFSELDESPKSDSPGDSGWTRH